MIVLDTHIWAWWVHDDANLPPAYKAYVQTQEQSGLGISAISCWEVAKLVEHKRLSLPIPVGEWLDVATARIYGCPLVTLDGKIRDYQHVQVAP